MTEQISTAEAEGQLDYSRLYGEVKDNPDRHVISDVVDPNRVELVDGQLVVMDETE